MSDDDKARYQALKKTLLEALPKKRQLDKKLAHVEVQIYNLEGTYLTETAAHSGGNIIQGFENYLKNQTTARRRYDAAEHDRLFSSSSLTMQKSLSLMAEEEGTNNDEYSKQSTPGVITVSVPPAGKNQELTTAQQNKLQRDKEYQRKRRASQRRSVDTGSDDEGAATSISVSSSSRRATKRQRMADDD
ncbi:chromatin modification-related protein eaf6 [Paramarasmius palmivorus]|uniref:Chromatin modification-related protein EAF6 n=1 Tax=Paramarasmius palmivorus TaxID=297713 RepID=A0AAW0DZD7_9AGAR